MIGFRQYSNTENSYIIISILSFLAEVLIKRRSNK